MSLLVNRTLRNLRDGKVCIGAKPILARTPEVGKIFQACGFDWMALDLEHSGHNLSSVADMSLAALDQGITALARVPRFDPHLINRLICNGAMGVIVPHVETAEEARDVVDAVRFPPAGTGGVPSFFPHFRYGAITNKDAMACLNREVIVVVLLETERAIENAHKIASVDGISVLHVGANDLLQRMPPGPSDVNRQIIRQACQRVVEAARAYGKFSGIGGLAHQSDWEEPIRMGMQFVSGTTDISLLQDGARNWVAFLDELRSGNVDGPEYEKGQKVHDKQI